MMDDFECILINISGGITFDTVASDQASFDAGEPETFTHTIGSLSNGYILLHLSYYLGSGSPSAITFDGTSMSLILSNSHSGDTNLRCDLWGVAVGNKPAGTYTISISGIAGNALVAFSTSWNGVNQISSIGTPSEAEGESTTPSVNVSSGSNEVVVDILGRFAGGAALVDATQTEIGNIVIPAVVMGSASRETGGSTVTMSWQLDSNAKWVIIGVPLKPA